MSDLVSLILVLSIIYGFLVIFTLLLISKLYKSYFVCGIKIKEIVKTGTFNYNNGDSNDHITSHFNFRIKNSKYINSATSLFPMTKIGNKKCFLYNDDKNKIVAKTFTLIWQFIIFIISLLLSAMVGIPFFIIAIF